MDFQCLECGNRIIKEEHNCPKCGSKYNKPIYSSEDEMNLISKFKLGTMGFYHGITKCQLISYNQEKNQYQVFFPVNKRKFYVSKEDIFTHKK